jgi:hypothetical protein
MSNPDPDRWAGAGEWHELMARLPRDNAGGGA